MCQYTHLSVEERILISHYLGQGGSICSIAGKLGRSKSTISQEVRRNKNKHGYNPQTANKKYLLRRRRPLLLEKNTALRAYVVERLQEGHSPELIACRLKNYPEKGIPYINHNSIYAWLYLKPQKEERLYKLLPRGKATRGRRKKIHRGKIRDRVSLTERPSEALDRMQAGHWEADLLSCKRNTQHLLVLHERCSRYTASLKLENKTAAHTFSRILGFLRTLPEHLRRTMTFDNGLEFAQHWKLSDALGIQTYFCDVYASWQKGGIENMNGRLRRDLPRKIDLSLLTEQDLEQIMINHNLTPRKVLGGKTPIEALAHHLGHAIFFSFNQGVLLRS